MELVPLRDVLDIHHRELTERLDRIESKLDGHDHPGKVSWTALISLLVSLIVAAGFLS